WSAGLRSRPASQQDSQAMRTSHRALVRSYRVLQDSRQAAKRVLMEWALDRYLFLWPASPNPVPLPNDLQAWSAGLHSHLVSRQDSQAMRTSHRAPVRLYQDYPSWKTQCWKEAVVQVLRSMQRGNPGHWREMQRGQTPALFPFELEHQIRLLRIQMAPVQPVLPIDRASRVVQLRRQAWIRTHCQIL